MPSYRHCVQAASARVRNRKKKALREFERKRRAYRRSAGFKAVLIQLPVESCDAIESLRVTIGEPSLMRLRVRLMLLGLKAAQAGIDLPEVEMP